jgi:hypothetical protein
VTKAILYATHNEARDVGKCEMKTPLMAASQPQEILQSQVVHKELDKGSRWLVGLVPFNQESRGKSLGQGTRYVLPGFSNFPQAL